MQYRANIVARQPDDCVTYAPLLATCHFEQISDDQLICGNCSELILDGFDLESAGRALCSLEPRLICVCKCGTANFISDETTTARGRPH